MASRQATKRLNKEYKSIQANPPPYIIAHPSEDNILEWHYVLTGPQDTPYEGGQYHGLLRFPSQYPFQPPSILMITPSGRFQPNTRICLSMSDYHPDTWNPAWSVSTILTGMLSFFTGEESTTGSINTSINHRKLLAIKSKKFNVDNDRFRREFPDLVKQYHDEIVAEKIKLQQQQKEDQQQKEEEQQQKEQLANLEDLDPEDRIRVMQQLEQKQKQQKQENDNDNDLDQNNDNSNRMCVIM
ncbi:ubiquitin-conjugating enzyme, putative [Candida dubliniensis CD36]|uniref:Ubiquitin-conjugating enzyme E2 6 n=1 Tax=Candida dubliniensis (strain CD36 / ATCC MYA-646 / CBS 7987 / NCPF 3949 / NRRL Y-17841) TaxID=573826 RepID=B9WEF0_CANDC|nr:ubiquitin-conjugating enzyme, putative [Candida dubliniensis CD36]CAX43062.1 ubiquitin-conjugating enzyme, putative [Candida dubliniensis CD36]